MAETDLIKETGTETKVEAAEAVKEEPTTTSPPPAPESVDEKKEEGENKEKPAIPTPNHPPSDSTTQSKSTSNNPMQKIKIAKITLNIGSGKNEELLKKGLILLQKLTPQKPVKTITNKRIPGWGLRPGLAIGCKVTVRKDTDKLLKRLLAAKEMVLQERNFDQQGNLSFGIPEYIDIEGLEYDPELKIIGLEVAVTLERLGFSVKRRKIRPASLGKAQQITKEDAIAFIKDFGVEVNS